MAANDISDIVKNITEDVKILVKGEIELAKAELVPSGKNVGVGAGMFGGAGYLALNAVSLAFLALSALIAWLFSALLGVNPWASAAIGLGIMALILLLIAGILAMIGKGKLKQVNGPERTVAQANATVTDVKAALDRGQQDVASGEALERHLDAKALAVENARHAAGVPAARKPAKDDDHWIRVDES